MLPAFAPVSGTGQGVLIRISVQVARATSEFCSHDLSAISVAHRFRVHVRLIGGPVAVLRPCPETVKILNHQDFIITLSWFGGAALYSNAATPVKQTPGGTNRSKFEN